MTTRHSPLRILKLHADRIAALLKKIERGEKATDDLGGNLAASRTKQSVKFGVVMDDKFLSIDMPWALIRKSSEHALSEYVLKQMRETRDDS
jgi:hypothetical protein